MSITNYTAEILLHQFATSPKTQRSPEITLPYAAEAAWNTDQWATLENIVTQAKNSQINSFNVRVAAVLIALFHGNKPGFLDELDSLRRDEARTFSATNTLTLQACHETLLRLHVLAEIEMISGFGRLSQVEKAKLINCLDQRLATVGAFLGHKQYILGLRRASLRLSK